MTYTKFAADVLEALYLETEGDLSKHVPFRPMLRKYGIYPEKEFWLTTLQNEWGTTGQAHLLDAGTTNERATITYGGVRQVEAVMSGNVKPISEDFAWTDVEPPLEGPELEVTPASSAPETQNTALAIDSSFWTGPRMILTDQRVVREISALSKELRNRVYATRFESNVDSQDLKSLTDALVAICDMAEPELTVIARILSHPKFQLTASLVAAVATIRGALGI